MLDMRYVEGGHEMAKNGFSLKMFTSARIVQILVGLLFITMGLIGFSTSDGLSGDFAGEIAGFLDSGESDLIRSGISAILLICGLVIVASLWVKGIPAKFIAGSQIAILVIWAALIIILDIFAVNFGNLDGSQWFMWIEQTVIHLIILVSIMIVREG